MIIIILLAKSNTWMSERIIDTDHELGASSSTSSVLPYIDISPIKQVVAPHAATSSTSPGPVIDMDHSASLSSSQYSSLSKHLPCPTSLNPPPPPSLAKVSISEILSYNSTGLLSSDTSQDDDKVPRSMAPCCCLRGNIGVGGRLCHSLMRGRLRRVQRASMQRIVVWLCGRNLRGSGSPEDPIVLDTDSDGEVLPDHKGRSVMLGWGWHFLLLAFFCRFLLLFSILLSLRLSYAFLSGGLSCAFVLFFLVVNLLVLPLYCFV